MLLMPLTLSASTATATSGNLRFICSGSSPTSVAVEVTSTNLNPLDLHKEIEDKKEIIAQLRDTDRMLEVELRACNETHVAFEVQQRILFRVYRAFVQAFSLFIRNEEERGIFLSLSMGERLDLIASKYSHTLQTTLKIYKNTVDRICKKSFNFIEEQRDNVTKLEKLNRNMREVCARLRNGEVRQRAKCDPKLRHKECESAEVMRLTKLSTKLRYELSKERDTVKILQIRLHDFENEQLQKIEQIKKVRQQEELEQKKEMLRQELQPVLDAYDAGDMVGSLPKIAQYCLKSNYLRRLTNNLAGQLEL